MRQRSDRNAKGQFIKGLIPANQTHAESRLGKQTPEFISWRAMFDRCRCPTNKIYHNYGGRGIKICERWEVYENFLADMGRKPKGYTIERIDNDGDYEPSNCRWASKDEQARNKRNVHKITVNGQTKTAPEWSEVSGIKATTITDRLRKGWPPDKAVFHPLWTGIRRFGNKRRIPA